MSEFDIQQAFERVHDRLAEIHTDTVANKTKLELLVGNGQPGLVTKLEQRVDSLESSRDKQNGITAAISMGGTFLGFCAHFLFDIFRKHP